MENNIMDIINSIAQNYVSIIKNNGCALAGNNGPYYCEDTPARNSAHLCVLYSILYKMTHVNVYRECINILADYLVSSINNNGTVKCMSTEKFDHINGLIGQAWVIEGLVEAYNVTNNYTYIDSAKKIFKSQCFDYENGYWERIEIDGRNLGYDLVFNHQLWFAAAGALILNVSHDDRIEEEVERFLSLLHIHFRVSKKGRIAHYGNLKSVNNKNNIKNIIKTVLPHFIWKNNPDKYHQQTYEDSYHLFNLYGFALIYSTKYKHHSFFLSETFKMALEYGADINKLNYSFNAPMETIKERVAKYAYLYNSPAFEYGYIMKTFNIPYNKKSSKEMIDYQIELTYSSDTYKFDRNTDDPETLTARLYELLRSIEGDYNCV